MYSTHHNKLNFSLSFSSQKKFPESSILFHLTKYRSYSTHSFRILFVFIANKTLKGANIRGSWVVDAHALTINFVVTGNKIYPQLPYFVAFSDGTQQSIFSDNEIFGGYGGVFKRGAVTDGVHIYENNTFNGIVGEMYRGGSGTDDTLIIRNNTQNNGTYGIHFPYQGSFRNILISENTFSNLLNKGVYQQFLIDGINLKISDNTFENMREEGIYQTFRRSRIIIQTFLLENCKYCNLLLNF